MTMNGKCYYAKGLTDPQLVDVEIIFDTYRISEEIYQSNYYYGVVNGFR